MSYIGNQPSTAAFLTDQFSGNGTATSFTMSVAPANSASALVAISGVVQDPSTYSVVGTSLNFSAAPPAGTNNISVRYLGIPASGVTTTAYRTVTDFTATPSQTIFSVPGYTVGYINVYRNGVRLGMSDYTATNGTSVILANAATSGDLVTTESFYVSSVLNAIPAQAGQVGATYLANGAATQAFLDITGNAGTGAMRLPVGTTAQRPAGATGMIRQNSTTGNPEWWDATTSTWLQFSQPAGYLVNYLIVAGGGGGGGIDSNGGAGGAGGGAGGLLTGSTSLVSGTVHSITVGAGGAGGAGSGAISTGSNSTFSTFTALGGGAAGNNNGGNGGSGGGGRYSGTIGAGTTGQGNNGGLGTISVNYGGGGGGGAGGAGGAAATNGGVGGNGLASSITGTAVTYAGGGGGGTYNGGSGGSGGSGGGGAGAGVGNGTSGTANTGGGGGGAGRVGASTYNGGTGGSGIVIIRYSGTVQRATGGTVSSSSGYFVHTFTSSGTFTA